METTVLVDQKQPSEHQMLRISHEEIFFKELAQEQEQEKGKILIFALAPRLGFLSRQLP